MNKHFLELKRNISKIIKVFKDHIYPILFFALLNLRVITWFQPGHIVFSGDFRPFLTWEAFVDKVNGIWTQVDFGTPSFYFTRKFSLFEIISTIVYRIVGDLTISQFISTYFVYIFYSVIGYFFFYLLLNDKRIALVAAFFLINNPLLLNDREITAIGFVNYYYIPTLTVLVMYLYSLEKHNVFYAFMAGLLTFFATSIFPNYRTLIYIFTIVIYLTIFLIFKKKYVIIKTERNKLYNIKISINVKKIIGCLKIMLFFLIGSSIVFSSLLYLIISEKTLLTNTATKFLYMSPSFVKNISSFEILRFIARWGFFSGALDRPYIPYREVYLRNPIFKILTYIPTILIWLTFILSIKIKKYRLYSIMGFIPYLTGLILGIGIVSSETVFLIFSKSLILRPLVEPIHVVFYSMLFGSFMIGLSVQVIKICINNFLKINRMKYKIWVLYVLVLLITLSIVSFPLYTGDVTRNWLNPINKGYAIPINIYRDLENKIDKNYWTILMPEKYTYVLYNESGELWGSGNPYPKILSIPYISGLGTEYIKSPSDNFISYIYSKFRDENYGSQDIVKILSLIGVKYVLIEKNIIFGAKDRYDIYLNKLLNSSNVKILSNYSNRVLLSLNVSNEIIYIAKKYSFYQNYTNLVEDVKNIKYINDLKGYVFIDKSYKYIYDILNRYPNIIGEGKLINVNKYSPSHIVVEVSSDKYFILVLQESYDDNWVVYINGKKLDPRLHFKVNGYGNGWLIPVKGFVKIDIVYLPSRIDIVYTFYPFLFLIAMIVYYVLNKGFHNPRFNFRKRV